MTYRAAPAGLLLLTLFAGCGGEASPLAWTIQFENMDDRDATVVVETRVLVGGCDGSDVAYRGQINLRDGGAARQPDELGPGVHGFEVVARENDCSVVTMACDEHTLPLAQAEIVSVLSGAGGGGGCAPGEICRGGVCEPVAPTDTDPPPMCEGEGESCMVGDTSGICRSSVCCVGCWDGATCHPGTTPAACGPALGSCTACEIGNICSSAMCVEETITPDFSLSPIANFYRSAEGAYWANGTDETFQQLGPVAAGTTSLRGYTGALRFSDHGAAEVATAAIEAGTGNLYTWGTNSAGALGKGSTDFGEVVAEPTLVARLDTFRDIAAGASHFCAIRTDGSLVCWGTNQDGRLGVGDTTFRPSPTEVMGGGSWLSVSSLYEHTCAIRDDRTLWCWGKNDHGNLGDDSQIGRPVPTRIGTDADWQQVATGVGHTCGIRSPGVLYCWGRTLSGVLGIGDPAGTENVLTPREVRGSFTTWQQVTAGNFHTCGLLDSGGDIEAHCWGFGGFGALGTGSVDQRNEPTPVSLAPNTGWLSITAGHDQTCGITADRTLCWGDSRDGWLGIGMTGMDAVANSPVDVIFEPAP